MTLCCPPEGAVLCKTLYKKYSCAATWEDINKAQYYIFCFCVCSVDSVMPVSRVWVCLISGVTVLT